MATKSRIRLRISLRYRSAKSNAASCGRSLIGQCELRQVLQATKFPRNFHVRTGSCPYRMSLK